MPYRYLVVRLRVATSTGQCVRFKSFRVKQRFAFQTSVKNAARLALEHFDFFYKPIYGRLWPSIRIGLLSDPKYCALINNYSNAEENVESLQEMGAIDLLSHLKYEKDKYEEKMAYRLADTQSQTPETMEFGNLNLSPEEEEERVSEEKVEERSGEDVSRSEIGLFEFVPTDDTQSAVAQVRKGMWSSAIRRHPENLMGNEEVDIKIVPDTVVYPDQLRLMVYPRGDISLFPQAKLGPDGVIGWYLMDAASILPVLSLGIQQGDTVLDLCAAPGGKSLAILQTLLPGGVVCNDVKLARVSRLRRMLTTYIPESTDIRERIILKRKDATSSDWDEIDKYDRVLVDAPCTTDRHALQEEEDSIFRRSRNQERLDLPNLQTKLLANGLRAVKAGGTVVYSTCSLSPLQNEGVVESGVSLARKNWGMDFVVKDLSTLVNDCKRAQLFRFYSHQRYGALVVPFLPNNFGPMYICKLQRLQ